MTGRRFSVGIAPAAFEAAGGIYQYSERMLDVLADLRDHRDERFVLVGNDLGPRSPVLGGGDWEVQPLSPSSVRRRLVDPILRAAQSRLNHANRDRAVSAYLRVRRRLAVPEANRPRSRDDVRRWLERLDIDLMLYPAPAPVSFEAGVPYVLAVHDLQHRIHPEFPEISGGDQALRREYLFRHGIGRATLVLVDSEVGKEDVLSFYGETIDADRVIVLPFLPAAKAARAIDAQDVKRVRARYELPQRFLFYPAQLWPHKNHIRVVEALGLLEYSERLDIPLVLVGSAAGAIRKNARRNLARRAEELGIAGRIRHLGYVPDADIAPLYAAAEALVMPTYFGPTNIPILEAWAQGCPVITSDIRGVREQAGDAALLADPDSTEELASCIKRIWLDKGLAADLATRGRKRVGSYTRLDFSDRLAHILDRGRELVESGAARAITDGCR
jgi:glycosyltransferase involved in cell wall biosynthesis